MQGMLSVTLQPWRVDEDYLIRTAVQYAENSMPGRVRFRTNDTDFLADQSIQQR